MIPVLTAKEMRRADRRAIASGVPSSLLMENAAAALVEELRRRRAGWKRVVVVCGPGNNGGDGLAAARLLAYAGARPAVFTLRPPDAYSGDAAENLARARAAGLAVRELAGARDRRALADALADADGAVDALFGTGLTRPLSGPAAAVVRVLNRSEREVLAADVPSGLASDTGAIPGPAVRAFATVALGALKRCHVLPPASGLCGRVRVADIGIPREMLAPASHRLLRVEAADVRELLPGRARDSHKGDFGSVAVLAGEKTGAAVLAARGALRTGAGLVTVFCSDDSRATIVAALPEAMARRIPGVLEAERDRTALLAELAAFDSVVAGPGFGLSPPSAALAEELVEDLSRPLVGDADLLTVFAGRARAFRRRPAPTVLTPHPGEAGRLLGSSSHDVQSDRLSAVARLARETGCVALLKGAGTLVAAPEGAIRVNPTGTPLLSTAGTGDVLAGIVGALLAGGMAAEPAAWAGAYLHGLAGEILEETLGDAGLLASELADAIPLARRRVVSSEFSVLSSGRGPETEN